MKAMKPAGPVQHSHLIHMDQSASGKNELRKGERKLAETTIT